MDEQLKKEYTRGFFDGRNALLIKFLKYDGLPLDDIVKAIKFLQNR